MQYGPVCNFADTVSVTFMHPEPIGLLSHVFFSLTFPVILGPNISGTFYAVNGNTTGAFTHSGNTNIISDGARWGGQTNVSCDASLCNTSYGSVDTIQPCSGYSLMIIKE